MKTHSRPMHETDRHRASGRHARYPRLIGALSCAALAAALCACAAPPPAPPPLPPLNSQLPAPLQVTPDQRLDDVLKASGEIHYVCRGAIHKLQWTQEGTVASLFDAGQHRIGTIAPGGYLIADDNSYLVAQNAASVQVSANDLAWSRLASHYNADGGALANAGRFSHTSMVQVVQTNGGHAPFVPCTHPGDAQAVPYTATYMLYRQASANPGTGVEISPVR